MEVESNLPWAFKRTIDGVLLSTVANSVVRQKYHRGPFKTLVRSIQDVTVKPGLYHQAAKSYHCC